MKDQSATDRRQAFILRLASLFLIATVLVIMLAGGLYYLNEQSVGVVLAEVVHDTCPHSECRVPHQGYAQFVGLTGAALTALCILTVGVLTWVSGVFEFRG